MSCVFYSLEHKQPEDIFFVLFTNIPQNLRQVLGIQQVFSECLLNEFGRVLGLILEIILFSKIG